MKWRATEVIHFAYVVKCEEGVLHIWSLHIFLKANLPYWMTELHKNKNKDECMENEIK